MKASYYAHKKCYTITLSEYQTVGQVSREKEQFEKITGIPLFINGQNGGMGASESEIASGYFFVPAKAHVEQIEQNAAFFCIDEVFRELPHKPDKKSLKNDPAGKYMELGFISPAVGMRYGQALQKLADQTGWRIRIADKVNQNELFKTAQLLCKKHGISLVKNPSYLPEQKKIQLKMAVQAAEEKMQRMASEFVDETGCECIYL